jgi:hypothetical protein
MPIAMQAPGSIYNPGYAGRPLFEDQRPRNVGDILTIVIAENINATKSSGANTNRQGNTDFNVPTAFLGGLFAKANLSATGANKFAATGGASAANTFNGTITVTVTNVLPNGNLVVSGEKQMLINQGNEFVRFSGVVNPNTIGRELGLLDAGGRRADRILGEGLHQRSRDDGLAAALLPQSGTVVIPMQQPLFHRLSRRAAPPLAGAFMPIACALGAAGAHAERLKDLAQIQGVRDNPLIGYGLVVGLDGTGDQTMQTPFTTQTLANMLANLGISINNGSANGGSSSLNNMQLKNVAAVMVTPRCRRSRGRARRST